jgi:asparagine synthetase B (glutamine-hydrolysing)
MSESHIRPALPDVAAATAREPWLWIRLGETGAEVTGTPHARLGQVNLPAPLQTGRDVYAEWQWDGRQVVVRNCRLGSFPIYYYASDKVFGVCPAIERLLSLGAPAELDDAAMAVYLRLGWVLGEDTVFRHIRALPPGGTVSWSGGQPRVSGGISHPKPLHITRQEAIATFADLLRQAVQRRASPEVPYILPLSGGRDSRSIFLELMAQGCRPQVCYTNHDFPPYRTQNIEVARLLAQRFDLPHRSMGQPASRLAAELRKNRLNNFGAAENVWCVSLYGEIAHRHPGAIVYEGSPGGSTYGQYCKPELLRLLEQGRRAEVARDILGKWLSWQASEDALQRVLTPAAAARFSADLAVERLQQELARHQDAPNPLVSFYFWTRGRHVAAMQPFSIAWRSGVMAVTPYLDHDLVEFLLALPWEINVDKPFHDDAINRAYPAFRDMPYAGGTPTPPKESNGHYRRFFLETLAHLAYQGTGELVRRGQMMRRLLTLAVSGGNLRMRMRWIAPYAAIYLTQIEALRARQGTSR